MPLPIAQHRLGDNATGPDVELAWIFVFLYSPDNLPDANLLSLHLSLHFPHTSLEEDYSSSSPTFTQPSCLLTTRIGISSPSPHMALNLVNCQYVHGPISARTGLLSVSARSSVTVPSCRSDAFGNFCNSERKRSFRAFITKESKARPLP